MQKIEDATTIMREKWRRGDEAMRDFTGTWFNKRKEEMETCFPTSIDKASPAATDINILTSVDIHSGLVYRSNLLY